MPPRAKPDKPCGTYGEGSVYQRKSDGRWVAAVRVPGEQRPRTAYARTEREARRLKLAMLKALGRGTFPSQDKTTVAQHVAEWLAAIQPLVLQPATWRGYDQIMRRWVLPELSTRRLTAVTARDLDRLYTAARSAGLSERSVSHLHAAVHRMLDQAVRWELLPSNPADRAAKPSARGTERRTLSTEQTRRLLALAARHRLGAIVTLAATMGMRAGEICGLRWQDVDLETGVLAASGAMKRQLTGNYARGDPKTETSRRRLGMPRIAVEALRRRHAEQMEERLAAGAHCEETGLVVTRNSKRWGYGLPIGQTAIVREVLPPMLAEGGLPQTTLHDLRHTFATEGLRQGLQTKVVSGTLGHSRTAIAQDLYQHLTIDMEEAVAATIDSLFGDSPEGDSAILAVS